MDKILVRAALTTLLRCVGPLLLVGSAARGAEPREIDFFEQRIRPILVRRCYECHSQGSTEIQGGLSLDSRDGVRKGGDSGPAVVPGDAEASLLVEAIRYGSLEMPPKEKLSEAVIADFVTWIEMGAPDPRDTPPDPVASAQELWETQYEGRLDWWSLQPVAAPEIPSVRDANWSDNPIDRFILAKLEEHELSPVPQADPRTLIRRLNFALTGLPPTPEAARGFERDAIRNPQSALRNLVNHLLDSPHFGERWARHWMDVVRYTDTYGYEWDIPAKGAWRYRDYLIRAFNKDVPFDQLVREQIAGDLLAEPRINVADQINESLIGPMFFQMGEKRHGDSSEFNGIHQEMLDNKIDAFSKAFQAMTIACARCHDHKLDAVAQHEYYALAGVFMSSRWLTNTIDTPQRNAEVIDELKARKAELRTALAKVWLRDLSELAVPMPVTSSDRPSKWQELVKTQDKSIPPRENPLHVWRQLVATESGKKVADVWKKLAAQYHAESANRIAANKARFDTVIDFREEVPESWSADGAGLRNVVRSGDFVVALAGERAIDGILPGGLYTNVLSPRLNGAVRTPYLNTFEEAHISFECCGGDFAARRTVYDNAFLTEKQVYLKHAKPKWERMSTVKSMPERRIYIEFATKTSNPNFPPRVGLGGATTKEQESDPRSWFGISRVVLHDAPDTPKDELIRFASLFDGQTPQNLSEAAARYEAWFKKAVQAWQESKATPQHVKLLNWLLGKGLLTNQWNENEQTEVARLVAKYREVEQQLATPCTVNGMADVDAGYDYRLNIRGDYDQLGDAVPRGYIRALTGLRDGFTSAGSGRRELAEIIADPQNPLTARVYVNRVWHWLFGTGIVATPNDFGHLGETPSHPELLDYLAARFMQEGWSTKKLIRSIVFSRTWQQSGQVSKRGQDVDPDNRLLHHYPLRRLEAEAIRDAILAVSGRLDPQRFGPPINPARANEDPQKRLFSGPLDGNGRRSIYTKITIMEPPKFLSLFNQPEPKIPTGRRDVTNTPAQSLALLNSAFVEQQAEHWAKRLVAQPHESVAVRLREMFRAAFGRVPTVGEVNRWASAVTDLVALRQDENIDVLSDVALWQDVAHAIFNTREFLYVR